MQIEYHNKIYKKIADLIHNVLEDTTTDEIYRYITTPPKSDMGDFAYPLFEVAKKTNKNPALLARELESKIAKDELIKEVKAFGPYLNFYLDSNQMASFLIEDIKSKNFFKLAKKSWKVMLEYSQPNTHKQLHIGHMRNLSLGNALVKIYEYMGIDVITATYPGDIGTHVAKSLWYLTKFKEMMPTSDKGVWLGEIYTKANNALTDDNKEEVSSILKALTNKEEPYYSLWLETRKWSIDLMKEVYAWAGVKFDRWYFESEIDQESIELAHSLYEQGVLQKSQGAIGIDLGEGFGFCLLIKSDGTGMYAAKDIALAKLKFKEFNLNKSYYLVDDRQSLHFKQIFKLLEKIDTSIATNCQHIAYNSVELPSGAMSSRKGNITPITELISKMEKTIITQFLSKKNWDESKIQDTAKKIAGSAIKFGMVRIDSSRKIVFDMNAWLKLDGETGPYLQYAYARINSLVTKFGVVSSDLSCLIHPLEHRLLVNISKFNNIVESAYLQNRPSVLCSYLFDLAKLFNNFYAEVSIGSADTLLRSARMNLVYVIGLVLEKGLELLGIDIVNEM